MNEKIEVEVPKGYAERAIAYMKEAITILMREDEMAKVRPTAEAVVTDTIAALKPAKIDGVSVVEEPVEIIKE